MNRHNFSSTTVLLGIAMALPAFATARADDNWEDRWEDHQEAIEEQLEEQQEALEEGRALRPPPVPVAPRGTYLPYDGQEVVYQPVARRYYRGRPAYPYYYGPPRYYGYYQPYRSYYYPRERYYATPRFGYYEGPYGQRGLRVGPYRGSWWR